MKIAEVELMTPTAQIIAAVGPLGSIDEPAAKRVFIFGGKKAHFKNPFPSKIYWRL